MNVKMSLFSLLSNRLALSVLIILGFSILSFATTSGGFANIKDAAGCMCGQLMDILPIIAMLMIIMAGVTYAGGQMVGAETRARANTWATAMLVGAIIGILIVAVAPTVLNIMYGTSSGNSGGGISSTNTYCDANLCQKK